VHHPVIFVHKSPILIVLEFGDSSRYPFQWSDRLLYGGSQNSCVCIAKSFVKNLPNIIVRSLTITSSLHHEKRYSLSFWKINYHRWKLIRILCEEKYSKQYEKFLNQVTWNQLWNNGSSGWITDRCLEFGTDKRFEHIKYLICSNSSKL